ncbi:hypothetical protein [Roseibium album]|uniref:hypothetical protein n=1 Tax=Roseibium album TaxID=311410 RepID=UPI00391B06DB
MTDRIRGSVFGIVESSKKFEKNELKDIAKERIDRLIENLLEKFYSNVPYAKHLMTSNQVNPDYYRLYTIEIILRLRMKRVIDGLTIHYFTKEDPFLAAQWCKYSEDEMLHDSLFIADLERLGMTKAEVYQTEPLFATKLLQGYFYFGLEHEGRPLASLSSSYFIEFAGHKTQGKWLSNVSKSLGKQTIKGAQAHVAHDDADDHADFVWDVLSSFVTAEKDIEEIETHIKNVYRLFVMFFYELYAKTIEKNDEPFDVLLFPEASATKMSA